jgi:glucose/arabinose dehydrogenase
MIRRNLAALLTMIPLTAAADYYPGRYLVENAFPALTFTQPLQLLETPSGQYWVLERAGRIRSFDPLNPTGTTTVLDITAQTFLERDHALMAMALDPDFATNRQRCPAGFIWRRGVFRASRWIQTRDWRRFPPSW